LEGRRAEEMLGLTAFGGILSIFGRARALFIP